MKMEPLYEWDETIEHEWLSVDSAGNVGFMSCCGAIVTGLPEHIKIPNVLMKDVWKRTLDELPVITTLDAKTELTFSIEGLDQPADCVSDVREIVARGLYFYDFPTDRKSVCFRLVAAPQKPLKAQNLPPLLHEAARYFTLPEKLLFVGHIKPQDFRTQQG